MLWSCFYKQMTEQNKRIERGKIPQSLNEVSLDGKGMANQHHVGLPPKQVWTGPQPFSFSTTNQTSPFSKGPNHHKWTDWAIWSSKNSKRKQALKMLSHAPQAPAVIKPSWRAGGWGKAMSPEDLRKFPIPFHRPLQSKTLHPGYFQASLSFSQN